MEKIFKTQFNREQFPVVKETNSGKSETIPDMGLSIRELLARGVLPDTSHLGKFDEVDPDDSFYVVPDFDKMDLAEKESFARAAKAEVERLRAVVNEKAAAKRAAEKKASEEKQAAEKQAEIERQERAANRVRIGSTLPEEKH